MSECNVCGYEGVGMNGVYGVCVWCIAYEQCVSV